MPGRGRIASRPRRSMPLSVNLSSPCGLSLNAPNRPRRRKGMTEDANAHGKGVRAMKRLGATLALWAAFFAVPVAHADDSFSLRCESTHYNNTTHKSERREWFFVYKDGLNRWYLWKRWSGWQQYNFRAGVNDERYRLPYGGGASFHVDRYTGRLSEYTGSRWRFHHYCNVLPVSATPEGGPPLERLF